MREGSASEFLAAPIGRFVAGRHHVAFGVSATFFGGASWGTAPLDEVRALLPLHDFSRGEGVQLPADVILDLRHLEGLHPQSFQLYAGYALKRLGHFRQMIRRQALLAPKTAIGAIIAGFYPLLGITGPAYRVFYTPEPAMRWLRQPLAHWQIAEGVIRQVKEGPALISRVRAAIRADVGRAALATVSHQLASSERSLQRALEAQGTCFQDQVHAVRIELAEHALTTEPKVSAAALRVGFSSVAHFSAWFKQRTGKSPAQWKRAFDR